MSSFPCDLTTKLVQILADLIVHRHSIVPIRFQQRSMALSQLILLDCRITSADTSLSRQGFENRKQHFATGCELY